MDGAVRPMRGKDGNSDRVEGGGGPGGGRGYCRMSCGWSGCSHPRMDERTSSMGIEG